MPDATIPDKMQPPPAVVLPPPMDGATVLASVDKSAKQSKSHRLATLSLLVPMGIAGVIAAFLGATQVMGGTVDWSDAAGYIGALAILASPAAGAAGWQRHSDSKVRAKALERG